MTTTETDWLRRMEDGDLEQVLAWRNHPEIRSFMYTRHQITLDEHRAWFLKASVDPSRSLFIFERDGISCGFVNFHLTGEGGVADWGFYAAPDAPQGTGRGLGTLALKHAFVEMQLHKVCGQALGFNERSIRFHQRLGFTREGTLREQHFDGERYHDVVCFGLLAREWKKI